MAFASFLFFDIPVISIYASCVVFDTGSIYKAII